MPVDDPQFEAYLKQFRPVPPPNLLLDEQRKTRIRWSSWSIWACATAAVAIAALAIWFRTQVAIDYALQNRKECCVIPFTLSGANASLFGAASTQEALDRMAFPPQHRLPKGEQSALETLSQEKAAL